MMLCCMIWNDHLAKLRGQQDSCLQQRFFGSWTQARGNTAWQSLDLTCKVESYVEHFNTQNFSIVLFGDSMERYQIHDVYEDLLSKGVKARLDQKLLPEAHSNPDEERQAFDSVLSCHLENGYMQWSGLIPGVWPSGGFYQPELHNGVPAKARISNARAIFQKQRSGSPDIIILNINLWDTYRFQHDGSKITNQGVLHEWKHHFWDILVHIGEVFPSTQVRFYHTTARSVRFPQPVVMDLNAAGSHLAHRAGWNIVDLSSMVNFFQDTESYLRDPHHPKAFVLLALFDIYLSSAARLVAQNDHVLRQERHI